MPGIAAATRFDDNTTLSQAVSTLTGLRPLTHFGTRSARLHERLTGKYSKLATEDKWHDEAHPGHALTACPVCERDLFQPGGIPTDALLDKSVAQALEEAHHAMNASALRAFLSAFVLALWQQVWSRSGGFRLSLWMIRKICLILGTLPTLPPRYRG
jgi:hypothetical protein